MSPAGWCLFAMFLLAATSALPALGGGIAVGWLYALCLGGAYGSQQAIGAAGYAQYFGRDHLGAIRGTSFVFGIGGAAFGRGCPFAASVDWTGSYFAALAGSCVLCLACGVASFAVRRPAISNWRDAVPLHSAPPRAACFHGMAATSRLRDPSGFDRSRNDTGRRGRFTAVPPS